MYYSGEIVADSIYEDLVEELLKASDLFEDVSCGDNGFYVYGYDEGSYSDLCALYKVLTPYIYSAEFTFEEDADRWKDTFDRKSWKSYTGVIHYVNRQRLF